AFSRNPLGQKVYTLSTVSGGITLSKRDDGLIKISELAALSEVAVPTIKHYMRVGLIGGPTLRTSRNMAWYDPSLAPRIRAIRELQRTRFLPLDVIKDMLDGQPVVASGEAIVDSVARAVRERMSQQQLSRDALLRTGIAVSELDWLVAHGFSTPESRDGNEYWSGDDLALVETIASARRSGLSSEILPIEVLHRFHTVVQQVVRLEVELFSRQVVPQAGDKLVPLTDAAVEHAERLIRILRRKLMIPVLEAMLPAEK
ncbi:MAG: MerR family transcriptional regulator, partial [Myxococcota bacterium]|nr:MerR family transcriptional regulator [Myxococcota bacterium]